MRYNFRLIITCFLILYIGVTFVFFNFYKSLAIKDTKEEAISTLNIILSIRKFVHEIQRPILQNWQEKSNVEFDFDPHLLSASFMIQYIYDNKFLEEKLRYKYKVVASNSLNPIHQAEDFEKKILENFRKNKIKEYFSLIKESGKSYFYVAVPIARNESSCLKCHGNPKNAPKDIIDTYGSNSGFYEKVGDLRAMISLKIPTIDILKYHKQEFISGGIAMFIVFLIFIFFIYIFWKKDKALHDKNERLFFHQNRLAVMGGMIGNISHQWKQPLTQLSYVLINLQLSYKNGKLTDRKLDTKIKEANEQIKFMSDVINDFNDFFSPKNIKEKYKIDHIVKQAEKLLISQLKRNSINMVLDIKNNFIFNGNANELVQVFVNIINNAKDAFEKSKTVEDKIILIKTYTIKNQNIITIENNAGTICSNNINKIFEPYVSTKNSNKATGIGLHICKSIVEKFNGKISAKNIKNGVVFKIYFNV